MANEALKAAQIELAKRELAKRQAKYKTQETPSTLSEVAKAAPAGALRGGASTVEFMGDIGSAIMEAPQRLGNMLLGIDNAPKEEFRGAREAMSDLTGGYSEYVSQDPAAKVAGTAAEFVGGAAVMPIGGGAFNTVGQTLKSAAGYGKSLLTAGASGAASEVAGQATEGTKAEPYARIAAAIVAPSIGTKAANTLIARPYDKFVKPNLVAKTINTGNKTLDETLGRAIVKPTFENQNIAKNAAYKAAEDAGITFNPMQVQGVAENARNRLLSGQSGMTKFNPRYDEHISKALARIDDAAEGQNTLLDLDNLRRELYTIYKKGLGQGEKAFDSRLKTVIDDIDDLIDSNLQGSRLLNAARVANKRYKKTQLLEEVMERAERQTASAGTGGNILNKYKQAINKIIDSPKNSAYFDDGELEAMKQIVNGKITDDVLRSLGKLSPTSNGLNMTISGVAAYLEPTSLVISGTGLLSKFASDQAIKMQLADLQRMLASGAQPTRVGAPVTPRVMGLTAMEQEQ
jgi:hypothetical protein